MIRIPVSSRMVQQRAFLRMKSSSSFIRETFIEYFVKNHGHKHIKSSSVVPLCDPTVPFVNAGMNQFKGVFLGTIEPPCDKAVNSQKCVRVGGKHNDLEVVGTDRHHHTFFEMLGNWSFGDYYKKEACQMAWDLLLGPYRLKPEDLVVTYFAGDAAIGLTEDRECRDIWKDIGVPSSRLKALGARDNFWEMGSTGPCGPCTEIHYVNKDGSLTEIWNLVFIQCNRESDGAVKGLRTRHVDTGMGLERMAAILQGVPSNYDTDLFTPLIRAIQKNSKGVSQYGGRYGSEAVLDAAYRRLADHARMISVCLADAVFPATSLNLKQIMRKSFKISSDVFRNPHLLAALYDEVASTLGSTYPELVTRQKDAKLIISHEQEAYAKLRSNLSKKWKGLVKEYPEVEAMGDVEMAGFALGYKEFKQVMSKQNSKEIPGELVFKLYDTHGFQDDLIERIAKLNNLTIDKKGFWKLLSEHKARHKTAFKEQSSNKGVLFNQCIENLIKNGIKSTDDSHKYDYITAENKIEFKPLKTKLVAILNEDLEWVDVLDPCESRPYCLVTKDTNFYCEDGGQSADSGIIRIKDHVIFKVESVFKIRDFVFHKGNFSIRQCDENNYLTSKNDVVLEIDTEKRLKLMRNHTGVHLLNAAMRKALPNSVVWQIGSNVTDKGLSLNLSVYGEKLSQKAILEAQEIIRKSIQANAVVTTTVIDSIEMSQRAGVLTVPGETYPESGLRLASIHTELQSQELCCGTHVPTTGLIKDICITHVKGAGSNTPNIHAITGDTALQARELFCRAKKLQQVIDLVDPDRKEEEISRIRTQLGTLCGAGGAPCGDHAACLALLDDITKSSPSKNELALQSVAEEEFREALAAATMQGRRFVVHFLRCSYLMQSAGLERALTTSAFPAPALLLGCAGGVIIAAAKVPQELVTSSFDATRWLSCMLNVFDAELEQGQASHTYAQMRPTKVSLINCEQLVQDAMRVAIKFAQSHAKDADTDGEAKDRRHN